MTKLVMYFLISSLLLALSGCAAQHHYSWTSQAGKSCFYTCGKEYHSCMSQVGGGGLIAASRQSSCGKANEYCYAACPDLFQVD